MTNYRSHYPDFDVMNEAEHWDSHTQEIVKKRIDTQSFLPLQFLNQAEADTLKELWVLIFDDDREAIISYLVHHLDSVLKASIGESQRKVGVPKASILIKDGLYLLNKFCTKIYKKPFIELNEIKKKEVLDKLMKETLLLQSKQKTVPVKEFVQKILNEGTKAYYSHPVIWSEIGFAGPAYPRGYVRSEFGLTDPWEAQRNGDK